MYIDNMKLHNLKKLHCNFVLVGIHFILEVGGGGGGPFAAIRLESSVGMITAFATDCRDLFTSGH